MENNHTNDKAEIPKAIKHARVAIILLGIVMFVVFLIQCYNTNLYQDMMASFISAILIQIVLWSCFALSYKRPFIGLLLPTLLVLGASFFTTEWEWKMSAEHWGRYTAFILMNFFTIRGTIYAFKHYGFGKITKTAK